MQIIICKGIGRPVPVYAMQALLGCRVIATLVLASAPDGV